jgi:hypothetical protein
MVHGMLHGCRVCEETLERSSTDFSTVVVDLVLLKTECEEMEMDLWDSFNAFCFTCRCISMSVPVGVSHNGQACYLRSQIQCFRQLQAYGLVVGDKNSVGAGV